MAKKTKSVEMYFGTKNGNQGIWDTAKVNIPASTPNSKLEQVARKQFIKEWESGSDDELSFCGLYFAEQEVV